MTPLAGLINYPGVQQMARLTRYREPLKPDPDTAKTDPSDDQVKAYVISSLTAAAASPKELLGYNRGHWLVENRNHRQRDTFFAEDDCPIYSGNGSANRAIRNNIVLAVVLSNRRPREGFAKTRRRLQNYRQHAIEAIVTASHSAQPQRCRLPAKDAANIGYARMVPQNQWLGCRMARIDRQWQHKVAAPDGIKR